MRASLARIGFMLFRAADIGKFCGRRIGERTKRHGHFSGAHRYR